MSKFRLALVRQKYRPDGGAERFVSRALEALDSSNLELNVITREWQGPVKPDWHIHICNPRKWGRISRERGFANAARALWESKQFDLVQSHERIQGATCIALVMACTAAGWSNAREFSPAGNKPCCSLTAITAM
jgi:UDP-glucose:(heptosyl)LPS alpha-1,3-glucosyltransferase